MFKKYLYLILDFVEDKKKKRILRNLEKRKFEDRWPLLFYDVLVIFLILFRLLSLFMLFLSAFLFNQWFACQFLSEDCNKIKEYGDFLIISFVCSAFFAIVGEYFIKDPKNILYLATKRHKIFFPRIR